MLYFLRVYPKVFNMGRRTEEELERDAKRMLDSGITFGSGSLEEMKDSLREWDNLMQGVEGKERVKPESELEQWLSSVPVVLCFLTVPVLILFAVFKGCSAG